MDLAWYHHIFVLYVTFLAMFSPPATLTATSSLLGSALNSLSIRRLAWKVAFSYAIVLFISILFGNVLLSILGINTDALKITGGAALLFQGWPLMTKGTKIEHASLNQPLTDDDLKTLSIVPLLFPLSIGGGTIAVAISLASSANDLNGWLALSIAILMMLPTVAFTFLAVKPLHSRLSIGTQDVMARISGIILVTLSLQLLVSGITKLVEIYT